MGETEQQSTDNPTQEAEVETTAAGATEAGGESLDVTALQAELEAAQARVSELSDQVLRARAEVENMRRRMERDVEKAHKFALESFSQELLAVLDSLELGLAAGRDDNATLEKLLEGTDLTLKMFKQVLEKFNVKEVDPIGQAFDPALHQAMTMQESAEHAPDTVMTVFQKGYMLNDRLIRPARVVVARAPAQAAEEKKSPETGETG